jgi:hypothetical protein
VPDRTDSGTPAKATSDGIAKAAVGVLEAGLTFLESLGSGDATRHSDGLDGAVTPFPFSALFHRDRQTNRTPVDSAASFCHQGAVGTGTRRLGERVTNATLTCTVQAARLKPTAEE